MNLKEALLHELTGETEATRNLFGQIPENCLSWAPHDKSMTLGQLALHIAQIPGNLAQFLNQPTREIPDADREAMLYGCYCHGSGIGAV